MTASLALSATDKYLVSDRHIYIYVINKEIEDNILNVLNTEFSLKITQQSLTKFTCLETLCNYGFYLCRVYI
jgi:hypothetical protein